MVRPFNSEIKRLTNTLTGLVQISGSSASPLPDYTAYSSQMAKISPTGVNSASYTPTNTAQACPSVSAGVWGAFSSPLPPVVEPQLCPCMYNSLSCTVKSTISEDSYATLFNTVCGYGSSCAGIQANSSTGAYGAYSTCNSTEQLSFAFNQYYLSQSKASTACSFGGAAGIKVAGSNSGSCSSLIAAAGTAGTNTVTGTAGASATKKSGAGITVPSVETAWMGIAVYLLAAGAVGAGMIAL